MAKTVTIYLDGQALARKRDGVGSYAEYLLRGMLENSPKHFNFTALLFSDQRSAPKLLPESTRFRYHYLPFNRRLYAILFRLLPIPVNPWLPKQPDTMWYPNFTCFPFIYGTRRVLTIHDFTYLHFPEMVERRNLSYLRMTVPRSIRQADHLLVVSNHVAKETKRFLKTKTPVDAIHPPIRLSKTPKPPKIDLPKKYILFVGTIEPRKNITGLLKVYKQLPKYMRHDYKLVVAGKKGWISPGDFDKFQAAVDEGSVVWLNSPSDNELAYAYKHAGLFVYMSHYEGFGMPLKEAAQQGVPIVSLDTPIAREAAGDKAEYGSDSSKVASLVAKKLAHPGSNRIKAPKTDTTATDAKKLLGILYPPMQSL